MRNFIIAFCIAVITCVTIVMSHLTQTINEADHERRTVLIVWHPPMVPFEAISMGPFEMPLEVPDGAWVDSISITFSEGK